MDWTAARTIARLCREQDIPAAVCAWTPAAPDVLFIYFPDTAMRRHLDACPQGDGYRGREELAQKRRTITTAA